MKEKIIKKLESQIENVIYEYEKLFKKNENNFEQFVKENNQKFKNEIAKLSTNTFHEGILKNIASDKDFIASVIKLNADSFSKLIMRISKK